MPARASVSAISATGSAYTPLPHVHSRSSSTRWTKFSIPAKGSCTHRATGASSSARPAPRIPRVGPHHRLGLPEGDHVTATVVTASAIHLGAPSGARAMRGASGLGMVTTS